MLNEQYDLNIQDELVTRIGLGGSCHWCTEAIFLSLKGVVRVEQGWAAAQDEPGRFSEAVLIDFNSSLISLKQLISVHLHTHSCTSMHSMRDKYRSAIYAFDDDQMQHSRALLDELRQDYEDQIITQVLLFDSFKRNKAEYLNYYFNDPEKPFCKNIVNPKLLLLLADFKNIVKADKVSHLIEGG